METTTRKLAPELIEFLEQAAAAGGEPITAGTPEQARANNAEFLAAMKGPAPQMSLVEDLTIPSVDGNIPVRRYTPPGPINGVLVYFHGGGWVIGDLEGHDALCRTLAVRAGCQVVNVDYRLAPEHRFPGAMNDCYAVTEWVEANAAGLPVVLAGDSSGGNLAAAVALRARDEKGPAIAMQVLLYPVTDADLTTPSYERCAEGFLLTRDDMAWFWDQYVPEQSQRNHPYVSPLQAQDLNGVAPAIVVVAGFDPLRDEGVAYAKRMQEAGVDVTLLEYEDMLHGFMTLNAVTPVANESTDRVADLIGEHLKTLRKSHNPINGATETSHVGIHVRDLETSLKFYRDELGMEVVAEWLVEDPCTREVLDLPNATLNMAVLRLPGTRAYMEVIEYQGVPGEPVDTFQGNAGTCHIAFYVDDLDELYDRLISKGLETVSKRVVPIIGGALDGAKCVYMTDPDGIRVEFLESDKYLDTTRRPSHLLP